MSTLPGGRFAPPPPVSRVAAGGAAFLLTAVLCAAWAGMGTLHNLTTRQESTLILKAVLVEPTRAALAEGLAKSKGSPVIVDRDLVHFSVERAAAADINVPAVLASQRAGELYDKGFPKDPGGSQRVQTELPRSVLTLFTKDHHTKLKLGTTAALIGMGAGLLLCAFIATGAARFGLPGAAALVGYVVLRYHVRLLNFWFDRRSPHGLLYRGRIRLAVYQPGRYLIFIAITLLVAGAVYSALLGGTKAVLKERRAGAPAVPAAAEEAEGSA